MLDQTAATAIRTATATDGHARVVPTRLGRLHVRDIGEGATTVLWSSMFVDSHTWDLLLPLLPQGRRYLLVDPPGLGLSEPLSREADITAASQAALDMLEALGVDGPVDWVGNAFGGHVGFKLGAQRGVLRSLVAISAPAEPIPAALRRQVDMLLPIVRLFGPIAPVRNAVIAAMLTDASAARARVRRIVLDSLARPSRRSMALAIRSFILNRTDVTAELAHLDAPCLFVASDDRGDWRPQDAETAATIAPRARAVTIRAARTLIPLEQPELLAAQICRFWEDA